MRNGFKKLTAILLAALMILAVLPASAWGTEQYSDPVMPGIDLASIIDPNTPVVTYVFKKGDQEISRQTVKNGDTLVEPEVTTGANEKFTGWEPAVTFGTVSGVEKTETITVTAQIEKVYYIFFKDKDGRVIATKEGKTGDAISGFDEVTQTALSVIPLASDEGIIGWKDENETVVESVTLADRDVNLTAMVEKGYWITFESNGGSYIAPHFYTSGQEASEPDAPTKPGFTFAGWYTDEALTAAANFATISASTTVYAKWTPANTKYTVIHWQENADNDDYSYKESETLYGNSGATTSATAKSYEGFTAQKFDQKTIAGDGSTIVNVYYKRNVYEVKFFENKGSAKNPNWQEYSDLRITAKYGANISQSWPTVNESNLWSTTATYSYYSYYGYYGYYYLDGPYQVNIATMPLDGTSFYGPHTDEGSQTAYYYVQVLDGEDGEFTQNGVTYKLHHKDTCPGTGYKVTQEDKYALIGFKYKEGTENEETYNNAKFYYTRNSYNVVYYNGDTVAHEEAYKYEADISGAGTAYTPTTPPAGKEGFTFVGWYADPEGTKAYDFTGKTMPAENIIVYAKWEPPVYTVTVYDADKKTVLETFANVPKGDKISEDSMPVDKVTKPNGSEFLGWVNMDDEKPFNFDTQITKNYSLYAKVGSKEGYTIVYNANGGNGTAPTDSTEYAVGSSAVVQPKGDMTAPDDPAKAYFLGWAKTENATEPEYQPGTSMEIVAADANENRVITLYAVWGPKPATTTLTYNANFVAEGATEAATKQHEIDGSTDLPNNATVTLYTQEQSGFSRPGFTFLGWDTNSEATDPKYKAEDAVIVDNLGEGANILYAIWEKSTVKLSLSKQVTGIAGDSTEFTFNVSYRENGSENDVRFVEFKLKSGDTPISFEVPIGAVLTIVESGAANYTTSVQYAETNYTAVEGEGGIRTITGITATESDKEIVVTNAIKTGKLAIGKQVTGSMGDTSKIFHFSYSYGTTNGEFTLTNGATQELPDIPYGTEVTITEDDYSGSGYMTSYKEGNAETAAESREAKVTISQAEETITFINNKEGTPDTGVLLDSLPYILILAVVIAIGAYVIIRKRRNRDDD